MRIWAESLVGILESGVTEVHGYDENELAQARHYDGLPLEAALWSLGRAVSDWYDAVGRSPRIGRVMVHPERGALTLADVAVSIAHDGFHHCWDIDTILSRGAR